LTTVLPGAVFGPILDAENLGSVQVIGRMLRGRMPGTPRIGLEVVDVRDIADVLRDRLGPDGAKVPTRTIPDTIVRLVALFDPEMRSITPGLGRKNRHTTAKAQELLGWRPRPAADTVVDCARSLIDNGAA
jgi:nucleoside-diphosphate-sugar epimerase